MQPNVRRQLALLLCMSFLNTNLLLAENKTDSIKALPGFSIALGITGLSWRSTNRIQSNNSPIYAITQRNIRFFNRSGVSAEVSYRNSASFEHTISGLFYVAATGITPAALGHQYLNSKLDRYYYQFRFFFSSKKRWYTGLGTAHEESHWRLHNFSSSHHAGEDFQNLFVQTASTRTTMLHMPVGYRRNFKYGLFADIGLVLNIYGYTRGTNSFFSRHSRTRRELVGSEYMMVLRETEESDYDTFSKFSSFRLFMPMFSLKLGYKIN